MVKSACLLELNEKDILQANATIIAGILILLTLIAGVTPALKSGVKVIMAVAITPFILSAFALLIRKIKYRETTSQERMRWATALMAAGLLYLIAAVILLLIAA